MLPDKDRVQETQQVAPAAEPSRMAEHLARSSSSALESLLGQATVELLQRFGPEATTRDSLAYFIVSVYGRRGCLRRKEIRELLLKGLRPAESSDLCLALRLPNVWPSHTLDGVNFSVDTDSLEGLERWYEIDRDDVDTPYEGGEGSHRAVATHQLWDHQLRAFQEIRQKISNPERSVLVHMPYGSGKLRLVATVVTDLYRSESSEKSIIWFAPGAALCEEAFTELSSVWRQLGSRDVTITQLYGAHKQVYIAETECAGSPETPRWDLSRIKGQIAVVDILALRGDDPGLSAIGEFASSVVFADAECLVHKAGTDILNRIRSGGKFTTIGMIAASASAIPEPSKKVLGQLFRENYVALDAEAELLSIRESGHFSDVKVEAIDVSSASHASQVPSSSSLEQDELEYGADYVRGLATSVERNERILSILKGENSKSGKVIFYAATSESARLFAGLLYMGGIKARSVTSDESPESRKIGLQRFNARPEKVLCVHGFFVSGREVEDVSACIVAMLGKSRANVTSMVGRLVQGRKASAEPLRLIVASDRAGDDAWVSQISEWSVLNDKEWK